MENVALSPSCRILTISSSLERAVSFVQQVQSLSEGSAVSSVTAEDNIPGPQEVPFQTKSSSTCIQEKSIPWTISNKYYSADVHFFAREIKGLAPFLLKSVPALIFVWRKGDAYKHHINRLSQDLKGSEPEVALAVRLPVNSKPISSEPHGHDAEDEEEFEDANDIDEFLSSRGFEFVDVTLESPNDGTGDEIDDLDNGIPSLPRVLDALSTIMWPSMQAATRKKRNPNSSKGLQHEGAFLDWANLSFDSSDPFPSQEDLVVPASRSSGLTAQARRQKEMEELARWLEEDDVDRKTEDDPWQSRGSQYMSASPTDEQSFAPFKAPAAAQEKVVDGFDDDFTVFVSAPTKSSSSKATLARDNWPQEKISSDSVEDQNSFHLGQLVTPHDGVMYHSLGSASDLGEILGDPKNDLENDDEGLPTKDEIRESAELIFGTASARPAEGGTSGDEDQYDIAPFDLSHVLSALQGMKAEIAGIENVDERRKAAAKVALGLVYGLDRDPGPSHDGEL